MSSVSRTPIAHTISRATVSIKCSTVTILFSPIFTIGIVIIKSHISYLLVNMSFF